VSIQGGSALKVKRISVVFAAVSVPAVAHNADKAARQAEKQTQKATKAGGHARTWRLLAEARRKRCQVAAVCPLAIPLSWAPAPYLQAAGFCSTRGAPFLREKRQHSVATPVYGGRSVRAPALFVLFTLRGSEMMAFAVYGYGHGLEKDGACTISGTDSARFSIRSSRSANASTKTSGGS
jgi:hypothetical protein